MRAQPFREQGGLIETALPLPRRMQRHWDNRVELAFAKTFVIECRDQPARDQMSKMNLAAVFKIEDHVANNSATAISRNRGLEVKCAMRAVGAVEGGRDRSIERLRAFVAKRPHDP